MPRRVTSARFVGRARELGELVDALDRAIAGRPAVALIGGEAGVGKTRLVAEFETYARAQGATVVRGGCVELGDLSLPFAPIVELLRALVRAYDPETLARLLGAARDEAERLVPDLGTALADVPQPARMQPSSGSTSFGDRDVDPAARSVRLELLLGVVRRLCVAGPLIVALEDLHWADPSTLDLVAYVIRNLSTERMVLVATYRTDAVPPGHPLRHLASELGRDPRVERYELAPLGAEDLHQLLEELLGEKPDAALEARIIAGADGNPFFAEELVAAELRSESRSVPTELRELILDRVRRLPGPAAAIARIVAIAGRGADDAILEDVSGLGREDLGRAVRATLDEGVLTVLADGNYAFRHALLGEAIADDMLPGERQRLHAAFVTARSTRPLPVGPGRAAEAAERARHWSAAGRRREAFEASLIAADAAFELAGYAEAGTQLDRVLGLWDGLPDAAVLAGSDHAEIAARAGETWSQAGEFDRAIALARTALEEIDPTTEPTRTGRLRARLASYLLSANDNVTALATFESALELLTDPAAAVSRRRALVGLGATLARLGRYRASAEACRAALEIDTDEMRWVQGQARSQLGVDLVCLGELEAGLAELRAAHRFLLETAGPPDAILEAEQNLADMLDRVDRLDEAVRIAIEGTARAEAAGLGRRAGVGLRAVAARAMVRAGRFADAATTLAECEAMAPGGEPALLVGQAMAALCVGTGRVMDAVRYMEEARRLAATIQRDDSHPAISATAAELAILEGRWDDALGTVQREVDRMAGSEDGYWIAPLAALGIRAAAERTETIRARRATLGLAESRASADHLLQLARTAGAPSASAAPSSRAHAMLAEAEMTRLDAHPTPSLWTVAAAAFDAVPEPLRAGYARYREAEAILAGRGSREAATTVLANASAIADRLGAAPLARAVAELARRARLDLEGRPTAPEPSSPAPEDPADGLGLTTRELEVLGIVAQGRTNRQIAEELFITEKTVGVHMTNILGKLGVTSRIDAAAVADRLGIGRTTDPTHGPRRPVGAVAGPLRRGAPREVRLRRAFLFSDIVRSSELIAVIGDDAWVDLRRWHDVRLRSIFAAHHGEELDQVGEGSLVVFERSADALDCAVEIQRALADHRRDHGFAPSVRIGVHVSEATRTGSGFAGRAIHEGLRIGALAKPGEILASVETIRDAPPRAGVPPARIVRLEGVDEPIEVTSIPWRST